MKNKKKIKGGNLQNSIWDLMHGHTENKIQISITREDIFL